MRGSQPNHSRDVAHHFSSSNFVGSLGSFKSNDPDSENMNLMNRTNKSAAPKTSGPIIAGNCVSCMGMVRISHSMSVNATVRCPHCQQSFVLKDLLDQSLPPLEVVINDAPDEVAKQDEAAKQEDAPYIDTLHLKRDEQDNRPEKPRVKFDIPKALKDGAKRKRRRRRSKSSSSSKSSSERSSSRPDTGSSNFVIPSEASNKAAKNGAAIDNDATTMGEAVKRRRSSSGEGSRSGSRSRGGSSTSTRNRDSAAYRGKVSTHASRLKAANPEFNVLAIFRGLLGCLVAFTMAYLMLIWIFKSDPLSVAPAISKAVPFAIPASMQNGAEPEDEIVDTKPKRELPSYLRDDEDVKPFEPETYPDDNDQIAVPNIDPDEVFGQEFGL